MAARRERERRRPTAERRYRFGTPEPAVEPDDDQLEAESAVVEEAPNERPNRRSRAARAGAASAPTSVPVRGAQGTARQFVDFKAEYAYVVKDLQRVGIVVGSLLAVLIVLYFVLPH
jgi:hypothetical protein